MISCCQCCQLSLLIYYFQDKNNVAKIVPVPPNIDTVNLLFDANIETEQDMLDWLDERRPKLDRPPANGECLLD